MEHALLAISHRKHVLVEKPIARDVDEAQRMIDTSGSAGVILMVAENARFLPVVRQCRHLIDDGLLGELRLAQFQQEGPFRPGGWRASSEQMGGGLFIDGGIHLVDMMVHLAGRPCRGESAVKLPHALTGDGRGGRGLAMTARLPERCRSAFINYSWAATRNAYPSAWVALSGSSG